ncbi:uncharacterized protein A1O9_02258 [Exophiala aquamarina CBS 119918]|uniref:UBC core domain-containing protein n=1 Tax=Exophiala aquamarina CBS 119918 TaxID=1182545 RepID=A0A072PLR9_9EURO|nr:uncharacterized protein A1O9_02258 [Exophiala aquamarina CBS 119918]KEF60697.1 hypothetical protein A1O9_02258 [Exophiala aquamarina CBS 119918]
MGRRLFLRHLAEVKHPDAVAGIHAVQSPEEGVVACRLICSQPENKLPIDVDIQMCATDLDEYPDGNSFVLFTNDESLSGIIPETLQDLSNNTHGQLLSSVLETISQRLTQVITCGLAKNLHNDIQSEEPDFEFEEDSDIDFGFSAPPRNSTSEARAALRSQSSPSHSTGQDRLRADVKAAKQAGFRIGVLGNLATCGILCISIRVSKLGLSEEAMQAWNLPRKHYLLLMIAFPEGYRDITLVKEDPSLSGLTQMRVALCNHYKPKLSAVLPLFKALRFELEPDILQSGKGPESTLESLFIDKPLNHLLRESFPQIVKARLSHDLSWFGAETYIQARQAAVSKDELENMRIFKVDDMSSCNSFSPIAIADHLAENGVAEVSLPLAAMQFVVRHVTRCREFCLVCHCHIEDKFEALKPYVCSKPLCLYQYMSLGFGPRIEGEIVSQPHVVDLLISFCYFGAQGQRLKDLPVGMSFPVALRPVQGGHNFGSAMPHISQFGRPGPVDTIPTDKVSFKCQWQSNQNTLHVEEEYYRKAQSLRPGSWVFLISDAGTHESHCRVKKIQLPRVELGDEFVLSLRESTLSSNGNQGAAGSSANPTVTGMPSKCYMYEHNFDDLSTAVQHQAIQAILMTLPSVEDMREYLLDRGPNGELKDWTSKVSESALGVLRWIIVSNRSCIMQLNELDGHGCFQTTAAVEDRVGGMDDWIQFRFAQGAPDKENRFIDCMRQETSPTSKYPTIFAWHGSHLSNWHSIIRQGLRFDDIVHGRVYGNGVYFSQYAKVSLNYTAASHPAILSTALNSGWKQSKLCMMNAISLNEVINRPDKFVHTSPHYVVSETDWIQTRYLFVKSSIPVKVPGQPSAVYQQDPSREAYNEHTQVIMIPITALSKSRRPGAKLEVGEAGTPKRNKTVVATDQATAERLEDDANSIASDDDDLALLVPKMVEDCEAEFDKCRDSSSPMASSKAKGKKRTAEKSDDTDFVPGTLDVDGIQFLAPPRDATRASSQALMRSFREALEVQKNTVCSTLGRYIDPNLVNNMYQWIVELHSFPAHLPLSTDMKAVGLTSVVLEMRFASSYPFTPPFIRVVKPRFLPFAQGGGGNVTEGGAMCMEILTNNGWTAAQAIDGLLLQVRMAICDQERPARLAFLGNGANGAPAFEKVTYGIGEAVAAYVRACRNHGWAVPEGFENFLTTELK